MIFPLNNQVNATLQQPSPHPTCGLLIKLYDSFASLRNQWPILYGHYKMSLLLKTQDQCLLLQITAHFAVACRPQTTDLHFPCTAQNTDQSLFYQATKHRPMFASADHRHHNHSCIYRSQWSLHSLYYTLQTSPDLFRVTRISFIKQMSSTKQAKTQTTLVSHRLSSCPHKLISSISVTFGHKSKLMLNICGLLLTFTLGLGYIGNNKLCLKDKIIEKIGSLIVFCGIRDCGIEDLAR